MKKILFVFPLVFILIGILFRLTLYSKIPVMPNNPYGLGDIIEFFIYLILAALCLLNFLYGLWQFLRKQKQFKLGIVFVLNALISFFGYLLIRIAFL